MDSSRSHLLRLLGLDVRADETAIKRRYRELAKALHPDMDGGDEVRVREVTTAYRALQKSPPPESQAPEDRQAAGPRDAWSMEGISKAHAVRVSSLV